MTPQSDESLLGRDGFSRLADAALDADLGGGMAAVEVLLQREAGGLTRFANSQIHQNVWREDLAANVRVVTDDGRVGVASIHTDDPAAVAQTARQAADIARLSPPDPAFPGLAPMAKAGDVDVDESTLAATPEDRAEAVRALLAEVDQRYEAAGAYRTQADEIGVFNTEGQRSYAPRSSASLTLVVTGPSSSGWAEDGGRSRHDIDPAGAGRRAVDKVRAGADPTDVDAGQWTVVLEPPAVGTLAAYLAYMAFGGRDYLEGRSYAVGRLGEQVADERVSLTDDPRSPHAGGYPVDYEGTPTSTVELLAGGVLQSVVHDRNTAKQAGTDSTGNALPAPNTYGPMALYPIFTPGDGGSTADLVAGCERGLLVTRFHYTNVLNRKETTATGMTRDGTFLIQDGKVTKAVRNLRFTQSLIGALAQVEAVSSDIAYAGEGFEYGCRQPALRIAGFSFTGTTSFG